MIRRIFLVFVPALLLVLTACGGGGESTPTPTRTDDTIREISNDELGRMVLSLHQLPPEYVSFHAGEDNGLLNLGKRVGQAIDPAKERADLERFGWTAADDASYKAPLRRDRTAGVTLVDSQVDLFKTAAGASGHFEESKADMTRNVGKTKDNVTLNKAQLFDLVVADQAAGVRAEFSVRRDDDSLFGLWGASAGFRHGRLQGAVSVVGFGLSDQEKEAVGGRVKDLARKLNDQIAAVLAGTGAERPAETSSPSPKPTVLEPADAFTASAQRFSQEVSSVRGTFEMKTSLGDISFGARSRLDFQAPDKMHMTMDIGNQTLEMLVVLPDVYIRVPGEGWYVLRGQALGFNPDVLQAYLRDRGFVDYSALTGALSGLTRLDDQEIDGTRYLHYTGSVDFKQLIRQLPQGLFDADIQSRAASSVTKPVSVETWLDKQTYLPRKMKMGMDINTEVGTFKLTMSMDFFEYNGPVDIPAPPIDAKPLGGTQL